MDISTLKQSGSIIFECISGSKAYGLDTPASDTDIRGVYILPQDQFYSLNYIEQISNESNDIVYYELRKFFELLSKNNPNILELLNVPDDCILIKHPLFDSIKSEMFLSKLCEKSFVNYAYTQIKKARGLNKKIVNPQEKERKMVLDFCYVYEGKEAISINAFLEQKQWSQENCGLAAIPHLKDCYNLFYNENNHYKGIALKDTANDISLSSIPKGEKPIGLLYFNRDAYSSYCKTYREYHEWEEKRNEERYKTTIAHDKNYDSKNMMHTVRLLEMAKEIAIEGKIIVRRPNRPYLLDIKEGKMEYEDLVNLAESMKNELTHLFEQSVLPDIPDEEAVIKLLIQIRKEFYKEKSEI